MRWSELIEKVRGIDLGAPGHVPPREHVLALQSLLTQALSSPDCLLDCIERQLGLIELGAEALSKPFYLDDEHNFGVRFPHWAPYMGMSAHEHYEWIVSAVTYRALSIYTYEFEAARDERVLRPRNRFEARAGQAGHIYRAGIHNPWNHGAEWAGSIHFYSLGDSPRLLLEGEPIAGLDFEVQALLEQGDWRQIELRSRLSALALQTALGAAKACVDHVMCQLTLRGALECLALSGSTRVPGILVRAYELGCVENRRRCIELIAAHDRRRAKTWQMELEVAERHFTELLAAADHYRKQGNHDVELDLARA